MLARLDLIFISLLNMLSLYRLCHLLFPVTLEQKLALRQESLLMFYLLTQTMVKHESISELK